MGVSNSPALHSVGTGLKAAAKAGFWSFAKTLAVLGVLGAVLVVSLILASGSGTAATVLGAVLVGSAGVVVAGVVATERAVAAAVRTAVTSAGIGSRMVSMVEERLPGATGLSTPTKLTKAELQQRLNDASRVLRGQWAARGIRGFIMRKTLGYAQSRVMDQFAALPEGPLTPADVLHGIAERIDAAITSGIVAAARQATLLWVGGLVVVSVVLALLLR